MASSYSTDLKLELMVTGENAGTWGEKTNDNLNCIQQAIAGVAAIDVAASDVTLVMANSPTLSNARNMVLSLTGSLTGNRQVLIPNGIEKFYIIHDQTTRNGFSLTIKTVSGNGFAIETTSGASDMVACYSDGTDVYEISLNTLTGSIASAQLDPLSVTSTKLASFAVTSARLASFAVTTAKLATNAVTAIKITQSTITQAKLASNSVGSDQLIATAVTPATYTSATITVDADGRITAASSGSAGAGGFIPKVITQGPSSGTFTASPGANRLAVYMYAGGGGGTGANVNTGQPGNPGGLGGFGFYDKPITQPFSQPFSVGAAGNAGGAGGNTSVTNVGTVNGGAAGGSPGNQPGATLTFSNRSFLNGVPSTGSGGSAGIYPGEGAPAPGSAGGPGYLVIYENTGT